MKKVAPFLPAFILAGFSVLPIVSFIEHNFSSFEFGIALPMLLFALILGGLLWAIGRLATGAWSRAAIWASLATFPLYYFEGFHKTFVSWFNSPSQRLLTGVLLVFFAGLALLLRRLSDRRVLQGMSYLAVTVSILIAFSVVSMVSTAVRETGLAVSADNRDFQIATQRKLKSDRPDIYYFVFDRYTGQVGLSESYDFNNGDFVKNLRKRGFFVADQSFSNYPKTNGSLASSLNAGYLKTTGPVETASNSKPLHALIKRPAAVTALQRQGYDYHLVGSWWSGTMRSPLADRNPLNAWEATLLGYRLHLNETSGVYFNRTAFPDLLNALPASSTQLPDYHVVAFQNQMRELRNEAASGERPKFVFSHLLMPHFPYVFDKDGDRLFPPKLTSRELYLRQLQYTNQRILGLVDHILKTRKNDPPIIILTADEGNPPGNYTPRGTDAELRQKTSILAAYYFPDGDYGNLNHRVTPVNNFRVIFNQFFKTDLDLLDGKTYTVSDPKKFLDFVDVTERIRRKPGPPGSGFGSGKEGLQDV